MDNPGYSARVRTTLLAYRIIPAFFLSLLLLPGCQLTADAIREGGRDDLDCYTGWDDKDDSRIVALVAGDGSVAVLTRVVWVPALTPNREYQRYYVFTPAEVRELGRQPTRDYDSKRRNHLVLDIPPAKFLEPGRPEPGRFVPAGTESRFCSPGDLPPAFKGARQVQLNLDGKRSPYLFADDETTATVTLDGRHIPIYASGTERYSFRTPVGRVWRVFLVPIAMVGDVLYTPFYIVAFFAYGR